MNDDKNSVKLLEKQPFDKNIWDSEEKLFKPSIVVVNDVKGI
jgi:hypothetical protein